MSNIIHKIEEKLGMGGDRKEGEKHQAEEHKKTEGHHGDYKKTEHKEGGMIDKVKDQIHGGSSGDHYGDDKKKSHDKKEKKEKKKKHEHGHEKHGDSSDSDSD